MKITIEIVEDGFIINNGTRTRVSSDNWRSLSKKIRASIEEIKGSTKKTDKGAPLKLNLKEFKSES